MSVAKGASGESGTAAPLVTIFGVLCGLGRVVGKIDAFFSAIGGPNMSGSNSKEIFQILPL